MALQHGEILIDDGPLDHDMLFRPVIHGQPKGRGGLPRDFHKHPRGMFGPPSQIQVIPKSEWSDRIKEKEATGSNISDILLAAGVPSLDQGQVGYCWAHSTTGCVQVVRAVNNQPYVPLSAYAVAATIKKGADEGGWCGLSAEFIRDRGLPSQAIWPQGDRNYRQYDKPETWTNAKLHRVTEDWADLATEVYDRNLTFEQIISLLLSDCPVAGDFNFWSHSVLLCDAVEVEKGDFGIRFRNSWGDGYGNKGFSVLRGSKTVPDSAVSLLVTGGTSV